MTLAERLAEMRQRWRTRRNRIKRWLKPLPRRSNIARYPAIKWFATAARKRPYLWSYKREYVMRALYVGTVLSLMPTMGVQVILALLAALAVRANLTVMVALQMITNPLTAGPIYYFTYRVGRWLLEALGVHSQGFELGTGASALIVGGIVCGIALALVLDAAWRLLAWEARVFRRRMDALHAAHHKASEDAKNQNRFDK